MLNTLHDGCLCLSPRWSGGFLYSPVRLPRYCEGYLAATADRLLGVPPGLEPIAGPQSHGTAAIAWLRHHAIHPLSPHNPEPTGQQHGADTQVMILIRHLHAPMIRLRQERSYHRSHRTSAATIAAKTRISTTSPTSLLAISRAHGGQALARAADFRLSESCLRMWRM